MIAIWILPIIAIFNDFIVRIYTDIEEVILLYKEVLALFLIFNFVDFIYYISEGICIGMGYQKILVVFVFLWLWVFMLPVTYFTAFVLNFGYFGIWIIPPIARSGLALSNFIIVLFADWIQLASIASLHK